MPFIDIYRFKIDSYGQGNDYKFGELKKANNGIIMTNKSGEKGKITLNNLYSYDYLSGNKNIKDKYYNFYLNQSAKPKEEDYLNNLKYKIDEKSYTTRLVKNVLEKQLEKPFFVENFKILKDYNSIGFIKKVKLEDDEKIIMCGDLHGSFHTFYRNMLRLHLLGIIDLENYTINPKYRLLFLGDIVDRGQYSLEILTILFEFMSRDDNYRLMINRGNHEEILINNRDGFRREIINKHSDKLWKDINKIFVTFPSCHILINSNTNTKIWCSHGFVPILDSDGEELYKRLQEFIINDDIYLKTDINTSYQIRWNDPKIKGRDISRGDKIYLVDKITTRKYLELFDYIIRGHNDNYSNAFTIKNDNIVDFTKITDILPELLNPMFKINNFDIFYANSEKTKPYEIEAKINKPIVTINLKERNENFLNVLTISTNTDLLRNLIADSFVLLRFDTNVNNILPSPSEIYRLENNINFINNKPNEFITLKEYIDNEVLSSDSESDISDDEDEFDKLVFKVIDDVLHY